MNKNRVNELKDSMKSFGKDTYLKNELLDEMFSLQREIVTLTFDEDHAATADLKIWDVENHLDQLNKDCGNVADEELNRFKEGSKTLCNLIKAEISGNRGEYKAFRTLAYLQKDHIILKNVELREGYMRTELDAVVINTNGISIVEVKNTSKNIFIDENGNYYRTGEYLSWDCNIAQKMDLKEELLRGVLAKDGIEDVEINQIVVFTDNRIEVQNKFHQIRTCFVSQLSHIIDGFRSDKHFSMEDMEHIEGLIRTAECKEAYPFTFDVNQYKTDFATLMVVLEDAKSRSETIQTEEVVIEQKQHRSIMNDLKNIFASEYVRYVGSAAAGVALSLAATVVAGSIRK